MPEAIVPVPGAAPAAPPPAASANADVEAMRTLLQVQAEQTRQAQEAEKALAIRVQMCAYMLDSGLAASRLPSAAQEHIRKRFSGQAFDPKDLTSAIEDQRSLVAALTAGAVVQGPGRVSATFNSNDRLQAAVDDLLQAPRDEGSKSLQIARLSGIRELYHMLTGDFDYHGGFYPGRVMLATTADFSGLVKNAMNKIIVERWAALGRAGYD